jgi:tetratricopeptide (TPR) repeat protein
MSRSVRSLLEAVALVGVLLVASAPVDGQVRMRNSESALLRQASTLESRGDLEGAERVLLRLLEESPQSSGGLFALERVLRAQGQIAELLPAVDRFLERDPESSGVRYLKLRVLAEVDSLGALRSEGEAWIAAEAASEVPYRDVARVYEDAFGGPEALALLRRGRAAIGADDALALEIGDLLAASGDLHGAVLEWAVAVGDDAAQAVTVTRRIQSLSAGGTEAGRALVNALGASGVVARRRAAARIALDLGLGDEALRVSRGVATDLAGRARLDFLTDVARRARDRNLVDVAAWAYAELGDEADSPAERRGFDLRMVELALAAGDTTDALEAQRRVVASFSRGSVDRRRAAAQVIRLEVGRADARELQRLLDAFRDDFPDAPELDGLAATIASALTRRGDAAAAAAVLEGVDGPRSSLEHAYLLLGEGEIEAARGALLLAVTGLAPTEATPVIQFAGLLGRLSAAGAEVLARAGVEAHRGRELDAARLLSEGAVELEEAERAPVLAEAARIADRGSGGELAASIRVRILEEHPDAAEVGEASLALARYHARTPAGVDEAIRLLEDLITSRPNAAVVPDARSELARLRGRGG